MICFLQGIVSHDPSRRSRRRLVESVATKQTRANVDCICDNKINRKMELIKSIGSGKALGALKLCST